MKFFTIAELCRSNTADRLGINNRCRQEHVTALTALVDNVLDPLREWYGKPITVNSGYRCPELNVAVKGSKTSQHMKGGSCRYRHWGTDSKTSCCLSISGSIFPMTNSLMSLTLLGYTSVTGLMGITGNKC